jgi:hypothetical protein
MVIHAADDADAIAQAKILRGSYAAELLDVEGLRIVKYLPGNGKAFIGCVAWPSSIAAASPARAAWRR